MLRHFVGVIMTKELNCRNCANPDCGQSFKPKVYNAIYCGADCRKIITNKKVLQRYYDKKDRLSSKRICSTEDPPCGTILSRYNTESICEACKRERYIQRLVGWGWSEKKLRDEMK